MEGAHRRGIVTLDNGPGPGRLRRLARRYNHQYKDCGYANGEACQRMLSKDSHSPNLNISQQPTVRQLPVARAGDWLGPIYLKCLYRFAIEG
jgi:hypothetical protein